ncbi:hypothetical protein ACA910_022560 [Epithemia clementina (nom. ined.)]
MVFNTPFVGGTKSSCDSNGGDNTSEFRSSTESVATTVENWATPPSSPPAMRNLSPEQPQQPQPQPQPQQHSKQSWFSSSFSNDDGGRILASPISADHDDHHQNEAVASHLGTTTGGGEGSSLAGAIFNFTNCIVGAGAIGLGGAFAQSGGLISILSILLFAFFTKQSLDLVILLSLETRVRSYEELGYLAFGTAGKLVIAGSKFLYSFGCVVAYVVVVKDNLAAALLHLLQHPCQNAAAAASAAQDSDGWGIMAMDTVCHILEDRIETTWLVCIGIIFPLCLLRDMRPLASCSLLSIASTVAIVVIILYLYFVTPHHVDEKDENNNNDSVSSSSTTFHPRHVSAGINHQQHDNFYETWLQIKPGYIECLGTFVFTFVSQHTVHLVFSSLKSELQTARHWNLVSLLSILISAAMSLTLAVGVYMTFGSATQSDIFEIYPPSPLIDVAKLMLAITMILTFPLPFFSCREILITTLYCPTATTTATDSSSSRQDGDGEEAVRIVTHENDNIRFVPRTEEQEHNYQDANNEDRVEGTSDLEQPLLLRHSSSNSGVFSTAASSELARSVQALTVSALNFALLENDPTQLKLFFHVALTLKLWLVVVGLALAAPSLGDVLDLVGCASGTMIAFVVPACLSFRFKGYSLLATILLLVGGVVGLVGTFFSIKKIWRDMGL